MLRTSSADAEHSWSISLIGAVLIDVDDDAERSAPFMNTLPSWVRISTRILVTG